MHICGHGEITDLLRHAGQDADTVLKKRTIGRIMNVGFHHRRINAKFSVTCHLTPHSFAHQMLMERTECRFGETDRDFRELNRTKN